LFEQVRAIGAEGIVSKRLGSRYRGGPTRDWLKTKCHATGRFVITGFHELGSGRLEALHVAEETEDGLNPVGQVRFGFASKGLWATLDQLRAGPTGQGGAVPIEPVLVAVVKYFGRHKGGALRDGVLLSIDPRPASGGGSASAPSPPLGPRGDGIRARPADDTRRLAWPAARGSRRQIDRQCVAHGNWSATASRRCQKRVG